MMVVPFLTLYLTTKLGFSFKLAGILSGSYGFGFFAGAYFGGKFSKKCGPDKVILAGLLGASISLILLKYSTYYYTILTLIFLIGLFTESFRPAMMVIVGSIVSSNQIGRTMALIRLAVNLGMAVAPLIGGFIVASLGYGWLFWIDGITCIISAFYFWNVVKRWQMKENNEASDKQVTAKETVLPPYRNGRFMLFLVATFLAAFVFIQWFQTIPVFIKTVWLFDERFIGVLLGLNCILIIATEMPLIHTIESLKKTRGSMLWGLVLIGASFLPFLFYKNFISCLLAIILFTFGEIFLLPLNNATAIKMSPKEDQSRYISWYWMNWSLALILGPMIGFAFIDVFGFSWFWISLAFMALVSLMMHSKLLEN